MSLIIDIHALQSVPPSNLNRDDSGSPKTAVYGGVRRHRVSSQSWKHAIREEFNDTLDSSKLGYRTKRVVDKVAEVILSQNHDLTEKYAAEMASLVVNRAGLKTKTIKKAKNKDSLEEKSIEENEALTFISFAQIEALANVALKYANEEDFKKSLLAGLTVAEAKNLINSNHSIDISLFGRMAASDKELNVDATCQVAHAISTHAAEVEFDYFTAIDDFKAESVYEDAGAAMIGTIEFTSSTLYRYANIDVLGLRSNLDSTSATIAAVEAFIKAFVTSMPGGKSNTFANKTLPDAVVVTIRSDRAVSLVGAFERPIVSENGYRVDSVSALVKETTEMEANYLEAPLARFVIAGDNEIGEILKPLGDRTALKDLVARVSEELQHNLVGDSE